MPPPKIEPASRMRNELPVYSNVRLSVRKPVRTAVVEAIRKRIPRVLILREIRFPIISSEALLVPE